MNYQDVKQIVIQYNYERLTGISISYHNKTIACHLKEVFLNLNEKLDVLKW